MSGQLPFIIIMLAEAIIIIFLIVLNVKLNKKNKKNNSLLSTYKEKVRDDELNEAIKNQYYKQNKAENDWKNVPYEVEFTEEEDVRAANAICVHLECIGRIATKKYLINVDDELYLGRSKSNGVVFDEEDIAWKQLHFVRKEGNLYIQNISVENQAVFIRKNSKYELTDVMVKVNDGDAIEFKDSRIVIKLV